MPQAPVLALLAAAVLSMGGRPAGAQAPGQPARPSAALVGWIRDSLGAPIDRADIGVELNNVWARTDSTGRFRLGNLVPGKTTIIVRRFGFEPQHFDFELHASSEDSVAVTMNAYAHTLPGVRTEEAVTRQQQALQDFDRRRAHGGGLFVTRADIERHQTSVLSETVRELPGVRIVRGGRSRSGLRFDSSNSRAHDCPPLYWLDGRHVTGVDIDDFPAWDVEAIELYTGPASTPAQFSLGNVVTCGTVVIWTRVPGKP